MLLKEIAQGSPLQIRVIHHQHRLVPHQLAFLHGKLRFLVQLTLMLLINITGTQENHLPVSLVVPGGDNLNHFPPVPAALGTAIGYAQIFLAACQLRPQAASFQKAGKFLGILCVDHTGLSCPGSHPLIILTIRQQPLNIQLIALNTAKGIIRQIDIYYCMINISYQTQNIIYIFIVKLISNHAIPPRSIIYFILIGLISQVYIREFNASTQKIQ